MASLGHRFACSGGVTAEALRRIEAPGETVGNINLIEHNRLDFLAEMEWNVVAIRGSALYKKNSGSPSSSHVRLALIYSTCLEAGKKDRIAMAMNTTSNANSDATKPNFKA